MKTVVRFELDHIAFQCPLTETTNVNVLVHLLRAVVARGELVLTAKELEDVLLDKRDLTIAEAPDMGAILTMEKPP